MTRLRAWFVRAFGPHGEGLAELAAFVAVGTLAVVVVAIGIAMVGIAVVMLVRAFK